MVSFVTVNTKAVDAVFGYQDFNELVQDQEYFAQIQHGCRVTRDANQTISNTTATFLEFTHEHYDELDLHSTVTNDERLTARIAGKYFIWYSIGWDDAASGGNTRIVEIIFTASTIIHRNESRPITAAQSERFFQCGCTEYDFAANDYVRLRVEQDSGGNLDIWANARTSPQFGMRWMSED